MRNLLLAGALALAVAACGGADNGNDNGDAGANMAAAGEQPSGTIGDELGNSRFAAAARAAGLDATLKGAGPYTVLVPTEDAFAKLPPARQEALLKPEGKEELTRLLSAHVLPGTMLNADIARAISAGGGKALLATMAGGTLTATREGDRLVLATEDGSRAVVSGPEVVKANGVIHPIDTVITPAG